MVLDGDLVLETLMVHLTALHFEPMTDYGLVSLKARCLDNQKAFV